jgi:hypothetical protein
MLYEVTQAVCAPKNTQGVCLRPIVSTIDEPTHGLAKHLTGLLGLKLGQLQPHVKNFQVFVHTLDTLNVSQGHPNQL